MRIPQLLLLALACLLAGCTSTRVSAVPFGDEVFSPRPVEHHIAIFETGADVAHEWIKIGRITARTYDNSYGVEIPRQTDLEAVMEEIKEKARELGADAIILKGGLQVRSQSSSKTASSGEGRETRSSGEMSGDFGNIFGQTVTAIRYTDEAHAR